MTSELSPIPNARGVAYRTGKPFSARRYTIYLEMDDVLFPELHLHARTQRGARKQADYIASNAGAILNITGMMGVAYQRLMAARTGLPELPASGSTVYLTRELGKYEAGTPATVLWSEWDEGVEDLNQYPVMVLIGDDQAPLSLEDFTTQKWVSQ